MLKGLFKVFASDSTTLPIGEVTWSPQHHAPELPEIAMQAFQASEEPPVTESTARTKIHQSSWELAFWCRTPDEQDSLLVVPLVAPLQISDCGVAEALYACWEETMGLELLDDIAAVAEESHSHFSMDRDASNIKSDREWLHRHSSDNHYRDGCYAHCLFTVSGAVFGSCPGLISGIVSLDLSTRSGAMWKLFMRTFSDVLFHSVEVVDSDPPDQVGPHVEYLDAVLKAFVPEEAGGVLRRCKLRLKIQCDIRVENILWYRKGGASVAEVRKYADELSELILHRRLGSLRRQRWLTTTRPVQEASLLACT